MISIILCLGFIYWGMRGAYFIYNIIGGFMVAICAALFALVRHIYNSKRYKGSGKT